MTYVKLGVSIGAVRRRWGAIAVGLLALGLIGCSKPTPYSRGQEIPLGQYVITVSYAEVLSGQGEAQTLAVHYTCGGAADRDDLKRYLVSLMGRITVTDSQGNEYRTLPPMSSRAFRGMSSRPQPGMSSPAEAPADYASNEWVAVAKVPRNSRGYTLVISNPDRREGQPSTALVALGR